MGFWCLPLPPGRPSWDKVNITSSQASQEGPHLKSQRQAAPLHCPTSVPRGGSSASSRLRPATQAGNLSP